LFARSFEERDAIRTLITGAGGFVGQRLVRGLVGRGCDVVALVHRPPEGTTAERLDHPSVQIEIMDLEKPMFDRLPKGVEAVVALAQSQHFRNFPERAQEIFAVNVAAHVGLLEWARTSGVRRFVHASSGGIYGPSARLHVSEDELLAVDSPLGFYLGTKLCAEVLLQNYRHFFETAVILRPFFVYGPGQREDMLVPRLIRAVRERRPVELQGTDGLRLNPIYVDDAVRGFAKALELRGCEVLNLAGPEVVSLRELAEIIGRTVGVEPVFRCIPGVPADYVGSTERAESKIGRATVGVAEGIRRTVGEEP
jgi:nucleoside-diphosphate-sugar epimerase